MDSFEENVIEFAKGSKTATVTFVGNSKFASRIRQLAEKFPDDVEIMHENADGSVMAHIPVKYIKINNRAREMSEEEKDALRERFKAVRINNKE